MRAETVVPPAAFEALAQGRTLHFSSDGEPYGAEQFFAGRRSLWRHADGRCAPGIWWGEGALVCFRYDPAQTPQCWRFLEAGNARRAELAGAGGDAFSLDLERIDDAPLPCAGPDVGS